MLLQRQTEKQIERNAIQTRLAEIAEGLEATRANLVVKAASGNFLRDILSDASAVSLHRFQMLAWTVVLGIVFGIQVYRDLAMPTLQPPLLALIGISGGTYLGFKYPERAK